jgi:rfaE bifunctional protein kinase chain/domain
MCVSVNESGWLESVLSRVKETRIAVIGDFCLDAYWHLDTQRPMPTSLETGLPIRCVRRQSYGLGGAGNVVANLIDLGVKNVRTIGMLGNDPWATELMRLLRAREVDVSGMVAGNAQWQTTVYAKPYLGEQEESRIDFGAFNKVSEGAANALVAALEEAAGKCDLIVINQQFQSGLGEPEFVEKLNQVIANHPKKRFVVDSRDAAALFRGAVLKLNASEAARLVSDLGGPARSDLPEQVSENARKLAEKRKQPVFVTRGERGIVVADGKSVTEIPGIQIIEQTDPVGAGDTVVAALAAALGSGCDAVTAARFANIAASITVKKLRTTGTATPSEILAVGSEPEFVYAPDLAENPRLARYVEGTEIELVRDLPSDIQIRHAIFDHDGTLSTLREGWEKIMEPMMVRAVLGPRYNDASPTVIDSVRKTVKDLIDKTTGIQTLAQMARLVKLVRQCGFVPEEKILDEHGYKRLFNVQLLDMVRQRVAKLQRGELHPKDFQIKNAHQLLLRLHERGVKLYLASGTDTADVVTEARALGYADLFGDRIYGAIGKVDVEAKKLVIDRIIREHQLAGHEFVTFGDGPVEMRETHKRGGICVGVCSDEVRRFGFNSGKRARLIRGGAGSLVGDFSQLDQLLRLLKLA